ncbi:hypothetical protein FA15DRAFT_734875 [Coprinopsis marcescibilis]|uniref:Uncharacterized protein n=1 Tax=Coprinopsis marcescibilis TaxID=230819 RepID=A0A5C3KCI3_COPMA|nr:hypothetical protein FA15DRAFT_734875 [Coprinopsis marcescibilis]
MGKKPALPRSLPGLASMTYAHAMPNMHLTSADAGQALRHPDDDNVTPFGPDHPASNYRLPPPHSTPHMPSYLHRPMTSTQPSQQPRWQEAPQTQWHSIDPNSLDAAFLPLPSSSNADLTHPPTIAQSVGAIPAHAVAGQRCKRSPSPAPASSKKKKAAIKSTEIDSSEEVVKCPKPTGSGQRPGHITRSKHTDQLINGSAGTRTCNDSVHENSVEEEDGDEEGGRDGDENAGDNEGSNQQSRSREVKSATIRSCRSEASQPHQNPLRRRGPATELATRLANALDPETQRARDEDRSFRSMQASQSLIVSQQLRDANTTIESLRSEAQTLQMRLSDA